MSILRWPSLPSTTPDRVITRRDVAGAYAVAIATDVLQLVAGPFGWVGFDEGLDVIAAFATSRLLGFHPLLLPTFLIELVPMADFLPTWTGCVALVARIRKHQQAISPDPPAPGSVIDV